MNAVVIATYNEVLNAPALIREIRAIDPTVTIVVVDDNSPDGTAAAVDALEFNDVHVVVRRRARGYGTAVCRGIREALRLGAERVATMDADFSHNPTDLAAMLGALDEADMAIGSRYVGGVRVINWQIKRLLLSLFANSYVRMILGLGVNDCTSGYRAYRRDLLLRMKLGSIKSNGYSFLVEMLWRAHRRKSRIVEVPIVFVERREGESKMSGAVIGESVLRPWKLRLFDR